MTSEPVIARRYIYSAKSDRAKHKGKHRLYLVEIPAGSNILAKIAPLPLADEVELDASVELEAAKQGMTLAGCEDKKTLKHRRHRLVLGQDYQEIE